MSKYSLASDSREKWLKKLCRLWEEFTEEYECNKQWSILYHNAQSLLDEYFLLNHADRLVDRPNAPLRALQGALKGAIAENDAAKMAKYTLAHARWRVALTVATENQSPLDALRAGNLQRAQQLADLYDITQQIFWYLLLIWELMEKGKLPEAKKTLEQLFKNTKNRPIVGLYENEAERAADLLAHVREIVEDFRGLREDILDDDGHAALCQYLINECDWDEAGVVADGIGMPSQRASTWITIAEAQIRREEQVKAQESLQIALKAAVGSDDGSWHEVKRRCRIAVLQAQAQALDDAHATLSAALETARQIEEEANQRLALREIAIGQAEIGDFTSAFQAVQDIKGSWWLPREEALAEIAIAQAEAGDAAAALKTLQEIDRATDEFPRVVRTIVTMQTKNGDLGSALQTVLNFGSEQREQNLATIATVLAEAGDITTALKITTWIKHNARHAQALCDIAKAQAKAGERSTARETFATAVATVQGLVEENKIAYLGEIAIAQAQMGEIPEVSRTCAPVSSLYIRQHNTQYR